MNSCTIPIPLLNALEKFVERRTRAEQLSEMEVLRRLVSERGGDPALLASEDPTSALPYLVEAMEVSLLERAAANWPNLFLKGTSEIDGEGLAYRLALIDGLSRQIPGEVGMELGLVHQFLVISASADVQHTPASHCKADRMR